ncbi:DNA-binding transcriptional regulator, MarR family [Variovorax sp. OK605]|jgi:DNA-binding MarR family transcriptional regulator|uniref:MarR family winged helix-turn-helix transcriptional regulator n=1 Tax=unclassified Variovorax TaxID=663243 RepID=UPI0008D15113|nr:MULTISPECIES: MarR family winged helix-turn-helix transcriptional regulator [unclassified Variovorax]SEJ26572.1 DNA-binding transcriptional regulator, MarR family [Variovorax sp. OK202]SFC19463.1 DNA-binding transcriptional regulator, MarR family [Variovorax sp. OK212]SFO76505.1 DNA-binding transcriptional regulator, MarR family [Variovorax sp. OK605]
MPTAKSSKPRKRPVAAAPEPAASPERAPSSPHGTAAWLAVVRAYNLCDAVMTGRLAAIGLRVGEHEVLATVATTPGITQQALAARCFVAKSGVSMLLSQMEAKGWVRRDSDGADARVRRLTLTGDGMAVAQQCLAIQAEVVEAMVAPASAGELATLAELMNRASVVLEELRAGLRN